MQRRGSRIDPRHLPKDEVFFPRSWDLPQVKGVAMIAGKRWHDDFGVALALIFAVVVSSSAPAGAVDTGYARNLWWNADGTRYLHLNATGTPNAGFLAVIDVATGLTTHDRIPIGEQHALPPERDIADAADAGTARVVQAGERDGDFELVARGEPMLVGKLGRHI